MAEYIEKGLFKDKYLCCGYLPEMSKEEFDSFQSADVSTVVHGHWIPKDYLIPHSACSVCGSEVREEDDFGNCSDYRPWCGAKMDEVE